MWIDQLSSVRLKGDMTVKANGRREDLEIRFQFQLSSVGQAVQISDPALEEDARTDAPSHFSEAPRPQRPRLKPKAQTLAHGAPPRPHQSRGRPA